MELRQLEYFVAVVEEASFTRAAARMRVAQPGVSAQIRQLERELGQPLLDRSGRTVRTTGAGDVVLAHARDALAAVAGARLAVDELAGLIGGRVAVGMVTACSSLDLADLLATFHTRHPGVEMTLSEANSDQLIASLRSGQLDVAVVGLTTDTPDGIDLRVIVDEELVAAVPPDDPLAGRSGATLGALRHRSLISLPRGTGLRTCLDEGCALAGFSPRIAFEASNPEIVAQLAVRGLGVGVLPRSVADAHQAQLHAVTLTRPRLQGRLALAWRATGPVGPAARALISLAHDVLPGPSDQG